MSAHKTEQERFRREFTKRLARIAFYNEALFGVHVDAKGAREWHVIWDLIHEHDAVFAIWLDPSSSERFELIPIKGSMPNSNKELQRLKMTAIACTNRDQAIGLSIMCQARDDEGRAQRCTDDEMVFQRSRHTSSS